MNATAFTSFVDLLPGFDENVIFIEAVDGTVHQAVALLPNKMTGVCSRSFLLSCDFDLSGAWAGVNDLFSALLPDMSRDRPDLLDQHSLELVYVLPHLRRSLTVRSPSLTDLAGPEEKTRNYAADRAIRIVHGLIELLDEWKNQVDRDGVWLLVCNAFDRAGRMATCFIQELMRRRPLGFRVVAIVCPNRGHALASSFDDSLRTRTVAIDFPTVSGAEAKPAEAEEEAVRLENKIGDDQIELQIQLHRLIKLWTTAGNAEKVLSLRHFGLYKYNTLGMYEDALRVSANVLDLAREHAACDDHLQWVIVWKLLMTQIGLQDAETSLRLAEGYAAQLVESHPEWQGSLWYMIGMLYGRYKKPRDYAYAEELLGRGLEAVRVSGLPDGDRYFQSVFNRNGLAMIRNFQGRHQEAIDLCRSGFRTLNEHLGAAQHRLHRSVLIYNIAQVYVATGNTAEAIKHYSEAIEMDPNYSEYYNERGSIHLKMGKLREALADFDHAISLSPPYYEVFTNRGQCQRQLGRMGDAIASYSRSLDLQPKQMLALAGRAKAHEEAGHIEDTITDYTTALSYDPSQWELYASRGVMYYEKQALETALADFNSAISIKQDNADLYQNRATVLKDLGRRPEAVDSLRKALPLTNDHEECKDINRQIDELIVF